VLSNDRVARRERVGRMARRVGAVAAVNGGYFAPSGDPVGALAIDGELLSEPVGGRSALILPADPAAVPRIRPLRFRGRITVNGRTRAIDGVNRARGLIPACGGRGGDLPTTRPNSVLTCFDGSELVLLTGAYGARPPREGGVEAVLRDGLVEAVRPPGSGGVPRGASLLTGTGPWPTLRAIGRRGGRRAAPAERRPGRGESQGGGLRPAAGPRVLRHLRSRPAAADARRDPAGRHAPARDGRRAAPGLERRDDAAGGGSPDALAGRP
jgi:hypothetical protein